MTFLREYIYIGTGGCGGVGVSGCGCGYIYLLSFVIEKGIVFEGSGYHELAKECFFFILIDEVCVVTLIFGRKGYLESEAKN